MKRVDELVPGDFVDLEGDEYADPDGTVDSYQYLYVEVVGIERETPDCIRVDFEGSDSIGFPPSHELMVLAA